MSVDKKSNLHRIHPSKGSVEQNPYDRVMFTIRTSDLDTLQAIVPTVFSANHIFYPDYAPGFSEGESPDSYNLLMAAADQRSTDIVDFFLKKGADANAASKYGITPLMVAARKGDVEVCKLLLGHGANAWAYDNHGRNAMTWSRLTEKAEIITALLESQPGKPEHLQVDRNNIVKFPSKPK